MVPRNFKSIIMSTRSSITSEKSHYTKAFTFQNISKGSVSASDDLSIFEVIKMCEMLDVVEVGVFDFPNFPEAKKKFNVIYFTLNPSFASFKGLFRGMVSLGKPLGVIIEYTIEKEQFTLKFYESDKNVVKAYLYKIIENIAEEIRFKSILSSIIENRRKIKLEESLLLKKLFA